MPNEQLLGRENILLPYEASVGELVQGTGAGCRFLELVGQRGVGKTALINGMGEVARERGALFSLVDMADRQISPSVLLEAILKDLQPDGEQWRGFDRPADLFNDKYQDFDLPLEYCRLGERERTKEEFHPDWLTDWIKVEAGFFDVVSQLQMPLVVALDNLTSATEKMANFVEDRLMKPLLKDLKKMVVVSNLASRKWIGPFKWDRNVYRIETLNEGLAKKLIDRSREHVPSAVRNEILTVTNANPLAIEMAISAYFRDHVQWRSYLYTSFFEGRYLGDLAETTKDRDLAADLFRVGSLVHAIDTGIGMKLLPAYDREKYKDVARVDVNRAILDLRKSLLLVEWDGESDAWVVDPTAAKIAEAYYEQYDREKFNQVSLAMAKVSDNFAIIEYTEAEGSEPGLWRDLKERKAAKNREWAKYYRERVVTN